MKETKNKLEPKLGKIIFETGPMFSGKTDALINKIEHCQLFKRPYLAIKLRGDGRYTSEAKLCTMSGRSTSAMEVSLHEANDYLLTHPEIKWVFVDESQFQDGISHYAVMWKNAGIHVYCAGLNGDFEQKAFPNIIDLSSHIDKTNQHYACCMHEGCSNKANYTHRLDSTVKELKDLGGPDKYISLCLTHLLHAKNIR